MRGAGLNTRSCSCQSLILKQECNTPTGMICVEVEPVMAMVAIMNDIPMVHKLDKNPLEIIKTGDCIIVDATANTVEVTKSG